MDDIEVYINIIKKEIKDYVSYICNDKYNKNIYDKIIEEYIDARYFSISENIYDRELLKNEVMKKVGDKVKILRSTYTEKEVDDLITIFSYLLELELLSEPDDIQNIISKIEQFRKESLNIKDNTDFGNGFLRLVQKYKANKNSYVDKFQVEYFELDRKNIEEKDIEIVSLKYKNIPFPKTFSERAIEKEFKYNVICEDKLLVEYRMVNALILQNVIAGNFQKEYIVEFTSTILNKKNKLDRLLKLISGDYQMEKINLLIEYKDFSEDNKTEFYSLMRQGYRFAIKLDKTFDINKIDVNILDVFSHIIITDNSNDYQQLLDSEMLYNKIIKI